MAAGVNEIVQHAWFSEINWPYIAQRLGPGPVKPILRSGEDIAWKNGENDVYAPVKSADPVAIPAQVKAFLDSF